MDKGVSKDKDNRGRVGTTGVEGDVKRGMKLQMSFFFFIIHVSQFTI